MNGHGETNNPALDENRQGEAPIAPVEAEPPRSMQEIVNAAVSHALQSSVAKLQPMIGRLEVMQDRVMNLVDESTSQEAQASTRYLQHSNAVSIERRSPVPSEAALASSSNSVADRASISAAALRNIHGMPIRAPGKIPKFDSTKDTAEYFLHELEVYFKSSGHDESQFLFLIGSVLSKDLKVWFKHADSTAPFKDWANFKAVFIARYDSWFETDKRLRTLTNKRQTIHESIESYIYEVMHLSKICFPNEKLADAVQRAKMGLFPRLLIHLGPTIYTSPEQLFEACKLVHYSLEQEVQQNPELSFPPLVTPQNKHRGSKAERRNERENDGESFRSRSEKFHHFRGGRGNTAYRGAGVGTFATQRPYYRYNNDSNAGKFATASDGTFATRPTYRYGDSSRGGYAPKGPSTYGPTLPVPNQAPSDQQFSERGTGYRSRTNSRSPRGSPNSRVRETPTDAGSPIKCFKCHGYGHLKRFCPNPVGIALYASEDGGYEARFKSHEPAEVNNDDLNHHGNSMQ